MFVERLLFHSRLAGVSVCLLDDGTTLYLGVAIRHPQDAEEQERGQELAAARAKTASYGSKEVLQLAVPSGDTFNKALQEMGRRLLNTHQCGASLLRGKDPTSMDPGPFERRNYRGVDQVARVQEMTRLGCLAVLVNYGVLLPGGALQELQAVLPLLYCNALLRHAAHLDLLDYLDRSRT